ncbi:unnamed protein product [Clonostachys byssicola]|uniref:N-acetyltransferase domain-containing protein n=1 Tax=Clonostachys byssicola TaxID=160290 RepID=A0A9N9YCM7_9HYPO|nr:unnamed protein product [Clonostachys byssicola]
MGKTRTATLKDVPAVIDVILSSVPNERLWTNFVPSQRGRGTDFRQEMEALFEEHIDPSHNDWVIEVVDLGEKGGTPVIVSVAVWDMSAAEGHGGQSSKNPATPSHLQQESNSRQDAEHETKMPIEDPHLGIFYDLVQNGRSEFVKRYPQFMYLQLLATHPNYRGQGYAKDLLRAYMVKAKQKGSVLTSFGGPFGYIFFSGLGFHDLGAIALPSGITSDTVMVKAMSLVVPKEARRRSIVNAVVNHITR